MTITIDDVNDNAPLFEKASYQASVREVSSMNNMKVSLRLCNWFRFGWVIGKEVQRSSRHSKKSPSVMEIGLSLAELVTLFSDCAADLAK